MACAKEVLRLVTLSAVAQCNGPSAKKHSCIVASIIRIHYFGPHNLLYCGFHPDLHSRQSCSAAAKHCLKWTHPPTRIQHITCRWAVNFGISSDVLTIGASTIFINRSSLSPKSWMHKAKGAPYGHANWLLHCPQFAIYFNRQHKTWNKLVTNYSNKLVYLFLYL